MDQAKPSFCLQNPASPNYLCKNQKIRGREPLDKRKGRRFEKMWDVSCEMKKEENGGGEKENYIYP